MSNSQPVLQKKLAQGRTLIITSDTFPVPIRIEDEGDRLTIQVLNEDPEFLVGVSQPEKCRECHKPILCDGQMVQIVAVRRPQ